MTTLADRLRGVLGSGPAKAGPHHDDDRRGRLQPAHDAASEVLGGDWCEARGHRFLVVNRTYRPGHRHGRVALADGLPPASGLWPGLSLLAGADCAANMLFVDLETTGLAGGAGTYAFLVGCGWFDGGTFRVRQFFLSTFAAERALLESLGELAATAGTVVTYNGKSFDLPLIETRYLFHRLSTPFAGLPHVDMLHPARRLWRETAPEGSVAVAASVDAGCRLSSLERMLCGHEREGDVPGFEIPSRYFQYVRTGDARPLEGVLEHNRLDLLSLALVTARAAQLLDEGPEATTTAREALGLGRLYERGRMFDLARASFARAAGLEGALSGDVDTRAEALRAFALLSRRERRFQDAAAAWQQIVEMRRCPPAIVREAMEALAIHHEHRVRDPHAARTFALQCLYMQSTPTRRDAVNHRLARLDRKLSSVPQSAALF